MSKQPAHSEEALRAHLLNLELQLMDPAFRKDRQKVAALLAENFREFGSSGREWSRSAILDELEAESNWTAPKVAGFALQHIAPDAVLVTYKAIRPTHGTLRSSVWVLEGGNWRILFHQGTRYSES